MNNAAIRVRAETPLKLTASKHFLEKQDERKFDLAALVPLYSELAKAPIGAEVEASIGRSTVIGVKTANNEAIVKTGWRGNRSKR